MSDIPISLSTAAEYLKRTRMELLIGAISECHYLTALALIEQATQALTLASYYRMRGD